VPLPRFQNLDETRRRAILAAAAEEFGERGFAQASYNRIIERAGISKGAMYYYFADKDDLYRTGYRDEGGVAWRISSRTGDIVLEASTVTLGGIVQDSILRSGASGVEVRLHPSGERFPVDERGAFLIAGLPEGFYQVTVQHRALDTLGLPISQSQVNAKKGVTFANGLRHILRQDPDIILVGEIRDAETARVAIQSSLTGHLVFSTLHTNDAVSAVTRLIDLGVEPYLVAASLSLVLAQRLVRRTCPACGGDAGAVAACETCHGSGFKGRMGVFELLAVDDGLRALISRGAALEELRAHALEQGMTTLLAAGEALVADGRTTAVEVERVIHG